jgi:hypothetical protein
MLSLNTTAKRGVRAIAEKLGDVRRPARDAVAITAQVARHRLEQAQGAALTLGRAAQRRSGEIARQTAARAGRSPILFGALLLAVATGGVLLVSARARTALRSSAKSLGDGARSAGMTGKPKGHSAAGRTLERRARNHQEALLDEGIEETFPASDPASVKRIT